MALRAPHPDDLHRRPARSAAASKMGGHARRLVTLSNVSCLAGSGFAALLERSFDPDHVGYNQSVATRKWETMIRLAIGFIAGYVLGSAAGRKRYEQIASLSSKAVHSKAVQGAVGFARGKVYDLLPGRKPQAPDPAVLAAGTKANPVVIT